MEFAFTRFHNICIPYFMYYNRYLYHIIFFCAGLGYHRRMDTLHMDPAYEHRRFSSNSKHGLGLQVVFHQHGLTTLIMLIQIEEEYGCVRMKKPGQGKRWQLYLFPLILFTGCVVLKKYICFFSSFSHLLSYTFAYTLILFTDISYLSAPSTLSAITCCLTARVGLHQCITSQY
jgi:hypothetical protein